MAKKLLFTLFICFLSLFSNNLFANTPLNGENGCNTPPPDSFRFAGFGYGFVDLAWNPLNPGDDHYITIYRENNNQWDSLYSIPVFNSSNYTISNLSAASRHKFRIRTFCENGIPSDEFSPFIGPIGLILELTTTGRKPSTVLNNSCEMQIPSTTSDWIGFQVLETEGGQVVNSALFEFKPNLGPGGIAGEVNRVQFENQEMVLVAADDNSAWPTNNNSVFSELLFNIGKINSDNKLDIFGHLEVIYELPKVKICPPPNDIWLPGFSFIPLKGIVTGGPSQGLAINNQISAKASIQNPAIEYLNIYFDESNFRSGTRVFELNSMSGIQLLKEKIDVFDPYVAIPIHSYSPGLYFLTITFNDSVQTLKVLISH